MVASSSIDAKVAGFGSIVGVVMVAAIELMASGVDLFSDMN